MTDQHFILLTIVITFFAFMLLYFLVCLVSLLSARFRSLSGVDRFTWCAKATKVFYFPLPILTGFWYLLVDDTLHNDVVNATTKTSYIAIYMHDGFMILDCILMALGKLFYGKQFSNSLVIHHFVVLFIYSLGLYYSGKLHYISMLVFVGEKPGPVAYTNWIMGKAKLTHLRIWKISQSFNVYLWYTRSVVELYILYTVFINWHYIRNDVPLPFLASFFLGAVIVVFFLTPYWTKLEAKRLYRSISRRISRRTLELIHITDTESDKKKTS